MCVFLVFTFYLYFLFYWNRVLYAYVTEATLSVHPVCAVLLVCLAKLIREPQMEMN